MASIDKVLAQIGAENIKVQYLGECMSHIKTGKNETEISFVTQELTANDAMLGSTKTAMIVWLDSQDYNKATAELKANESKLSREQQLENALNAIVNHPEVHKIFDWAICGIANNSASETPGRKMRMDSFYSFKKDFEISKLLVGDVDCKGGAK